jgi:hypothetical protein
MFGLMNLREKLGSRKLEEGRKLRKVAYGANSTRLKEVAKLVQVAICIEPYYRNTENRFFVLLTSFKETFSPHINEPIVRSQLQSVENQFIKGCVENYIFFHNL